MQIASDPVDVQDLQFKLQCRLKVFDRTEGRPIKNTTNLVAAASRFGLIFAGCNSPKLKVLRFASIEDCPSSEAVGNYSRREVSLPSVPEHISVNCDHTKLAVVLEKDNCPVVQFYDVTSFVSQNVNLISEVRLSTTPNVKVSVANWHPTIENIFTECKTDGTLGVYELKGNSVDINKLPAEANVTCFCWSPKGKQIAVGSKDGNLTHYKPDLKAVKKINAPPFEKPYTIISLQWISNYQFIGVFEPLDTSDDQCCLVLIDAPKTGNPTFTNFYDVCYSNGNYRKPQFYLLFEQHWNIVIVSSANSMEIGVLAAKGESWIQYTLPDTARAELPLDENREETYPLGLAIDTSSVKPIPWGESTLQPAPSLLLLSHQGVLCSFKIINLKEGIPRINSPPENIADLSGLGAFTTGAVLKPAVEVPKTDPQFSIQPAQQQVLPQNPQVQKETTSLSFSLATSPPQFSFLTPQVTIQPIQKPALPVQPQAASTSASLFGPQISVTPKVTANNAATSLIGSMLLNAGNNASLPSNVASSVASQPAQQFSFSSFGQSQPTTAAPSYETASKPETQPVPTPVQLEPQETNEEIEEILKQMIQMEVSALEDEVKIVLHGGRNIKTDFDPAEIDVILNNTRDIEDFVKDVVETSESQQSEIHTLKQNTLQTWAWYEEAISKHKALQSEDLKLLCRIRPLDSVSEKHLASMKQMEYYLSSQLKQAHKALDEQWDDFQDFCRNVTRTPMPTMETIFQTLVKQNVILQRQEYNLKEIQRQVQARKKKSADILNSADENDNLETSMQKMTLDAEDIHRMYQQRVLKRFKPPSEEVTNRLKEIILSREIPHVTVKSQVGSSILQTPPRHRLKTVHQQMTPDVRNTEAARNLSFFQSTPIEIKPEHPMTTAQIPSTPLSAFASTSNVPSKFDPGENLSSKIATLSTNEPAVTPSTSFAAPVSSNQTKPGINFGGFGKETAIPSSSLTFGVQAQNQFSTSKPTTSNITGTAGIFSSFNKQLTSEPTAGTSASNPTLSFGNSGSALGSLESSVKPPGTNIASFFSKPPSSMSTADSTQSTKGSFFTPITSIQLTNSNTQQTVMSSNTTKASAFAPITAISSTGSSKPSALTTSTASSSGVSFGFGKSQLVSSASSSTSPVVTPSSSTSVKSSPFSIANIISVSSPTSGVASATPTTSGIVGTASAASTGFSFGSVSQSANTSRPLFGSGSSQISSTTSTTTTITNATTLLGAISTTTTTVLTSSASTSKPGSIFGSVQPQTSTGTVDIFKSGSVPSSSTPSLSELASTGSTSSGINVSSTTSLGSIFGTSSSATPSTISGTSFSKSAISGSMFGKTATVEGATPSFGTSASMASSSSLFSSAASSTSASGSGPLFGAAASSTTTSTPLFGTTSSTASSGSIFGAGTSSTTTSSSFFGSTSSSGSIFGKAATATTTTSSLFGSTSSSGSIFGKSTSSSTTTSTPVFGATTPPSTGSALFGTIAASTTSTSSLFGASTTSSGSVFGSVPSTTVTGSIFGTAISSTPSSGSIFGSAVSAPTSSAPLFGTAAPSTSSGSIFGSAASTTSSGSLPGTSTVFGAVAPTSTTTGSMFGAATQETTKSVFGSASTSGQSVFGTPTTSSPFAATSSFGANTTTTSSSSIFGSATSFGGGASAFGSVSSSSSPFGAATSSAPTFGGAATFGSPPTSSASPFGGSPFGSTAAAASPFGAAATSAVSPFGNTPTSTASPFGAASSSSPFEASTSPFVKSPTFGQSSGFGSSFGATPATSSSIFGQAASGTSNSIFGNSSTSVFGGTTTTTSTFGNTSSPFGTASSAGASSPFGQAAPSGGFFGSSQSVFGSSGSNENTGTSFGFGSLNVGASTQSPFAKTTETKSPFGPSTFSTTSSSGSLFGSSTFGNASSGGSVFGQSTFGNTFGTNQQTSGPFSAGSGSVSQSGFGSTPAFQKSSGFGAQPAFGGSPAFGSTPSFGGSPSFGGNASFGSTNKVFGSPNTSGVFGSSTQPQQQAPAFGNMSNQNTIGFGNLVQQSPNSGPNAPFSGNSSFSSWR